ncbi:DUF4149 domain-containing protein [Variovorax sp. HJSM1_2]|uniref:DUF4149 domain-containing protein n=1 Tax=Variovorax sp. HJSM1_2 TaxID=3366263 RepID=UPI003BCDFF5D
MLKQRLPTFLAALWWGSLTTLGFIVVPLLFASLPSPAIAGATAAKLFTAQTWLSMACAIILLLFTRSKSPDEQAAIAPTALLFIAGGLLLALLAEFAVAPRIVARENLKLWHSLGSGMYVLQWLCAGVTLWKLSPAQQR